MLAHRGEIIRFAPPEFARDLERRLRQALKLVNSLRIDAMHACDPAPEWRLDPELLEQRLSDIEEILQ